MSAKLAASSDISATRIESVDFKGMFQTQNKNTLTSQELQQLLKHLTIERLLQISKDIETLVRSVEEGGASSGQLTRAGVGAYLLGQHQVADRLLARAQGDAVAHYVRGLVLLALERPEEAEAQFIAAAKAGHDPIECTLKRAGALRLQGKIDEAEQVLRSTGTEGARRAEYSYQMGAILADRGDAYGAIEYFERAVDMDRHHTQALFRLAGENALYGNDEEAIRLYEQCLGRPPIHLGALINLGILYEDRALYRPAAFCFKNVLAVYPNHPRAQMFLKDTEATHRMFIDDEQAREEERLQQLLMRSVDDFELSQRVRNVLAQLGIKTLGDLTRITEQQLLSAKNFGDNSLNELRDLMHLHGLRIGQNAQPAKKPMDTGPLGTLDLQPHQHVYLGKPISDLNLSVRARKCMARLNITTVGELIMKTPDELLAAKNFGVTSLNEIRQKLAELGLHLRNDSTFESGHKHKTSADN